MEVSSLRLDASTLIFSVAMLALFMAVVSFILDSGVPRPRSGLQEWGNAMLCFAGAFLLFFFWGHGPWLPIFLVANALVMAALPYGLLAHARLFEVRIPRGAIAIVTAFGMSGVLAVAFFNASRAVSIFTVSLGMALQLGLIATMIQQRRHKKTTPLAWFSGLVMVLLAIAFAIRAMLAIFGDVSSVTPAANSFHQVGILILGGMSIAVSSIGFIAMVNERQQRETVDRMRRDGLTGLYTRGAFFDMAEEIENAGNAAGYAIIFVDIDHFKAVNDSFGHAAGDVTLAHAGRLIANSIRISDIAVRYGGEEFCILLRGCAEPEAAQFADSLVAKAPRQAVRLRDGRSIQFTLSAGYACRPARSVQKQGHETLEDVIERADQALYRAKGQGRNRALAAFPPAVASPALLTQPLFQA